MRGVALRIDHVTVAGASLAQLQARFAAVGLRTEYGGVHSNGVTHMALLGFADGSYIELISTVTPGATSPVWDPQIRRDGGPVAWAVTPDDIAAEASRLRALGIPVRGPVHQTRTRSDGTLVDWDVAIVGDGPQGATYPFLIVDRTPRSNRVRPSPSIADSGLTGIALVVIAVRDLTARIADFQHAFTWTAPQLHDDSQLDARVAWFTDTPVVLASPVAADSPLEDRLRRFGDSPCAFVIESSDTGWAAVQVPLGPRRTWFGRILRWVDPVQLDGMWLGMIH